MSQVSEMCREFIPGFSVGAACGAGTLKKPQCFCTGQEASKSLLHLDLSTSCPMF